MILPGGADYSAIVKQFQESNYLYVDELFYYVFLLIHGDDCVIQVDAIEADLMLSLLDTMADEEPNNDHGRVHALNRTYAEINQIMSQLQFAASIYRPVIDSILGDDFYNSGLSAVQTQSNFIVLTLEEAIYDAS